VGVGHALVSSSNPVARGRRAIRLSAVAAVLVALFAWAAVGWWPTKDDPASRFVTLPPGAALPGGEECAERVRREGWEPRPQNASFNGTPGEPFRVPATDFRPEERVNRLLRRVNGRFTGTTDEILQWASCKWGFDEETVRAVAAVESWWNQHAVGDRGESVGLFQVRCLWGRFHVAACPSSRLSSAYNADYALAFRRACYEGLFWFWFPSDPAQKKMRGDVWGCIGMWFSGRYRDDRAEEYVARVRAYATEKPWLGWPASDS
jgi:hypothetical protein